MLEGTLQLSLGGLELLLKSANQFLARDNAGRAAPRDRGRRRLGSILENDQKEALVRPGSHDRPDCHLDAWACWITLVQRVVKCNGLILSNCLVERCSQLRTKVLSGQAQHIHRRLSGGHFQVHTSRALEMNNFKPIVDQHPDGCAML